MCRSISLDVQVLGLMHLILLAYEQLACLFWKNW